MTSQQRLLNASFNQDNSCFSICTRDGYKIFNCEGGNECYHRDDGAINIVEMLYSTSLLAIVGAGEQPALSPRRLCLFNTETGTFLKKLNFVTAILAIRLNRKRLVVVLEESTYIYDLSNLSILDSIDTVPNPKGLCAFSPKEDNCYLALPASTDKGVVLIYNVNELHSHCQINAHKSPLAAMALSSDGSYIATASEQGTVIRVYLVSQPSEKFTFRRGTYPAAIYSLSLGPPSHLPRLLVATSSSGSVHVFTLGLMTADRNKRSTGLLATVIPTSLNDALEPSYHHVVLHNVLPAGVKSRAIICNVEEASMVKVMGLTTNTLRVRILSITYNGYFNDYSVIIADDNKRPWNLERECNLLASPSEQISANFVK
ncbi:hypothetical protein SUGI_0227190 [Cryptomeria japonica]|uniref:autophagy-related protein 18b n=1 Tax=Cryptomeria japonica TaxID=3369 RepID=UPI002408C2BD|nr:autophagy-related protein 18b [Cryptomeria japonica]GLJ14158.1 hypothetical protein SUGI_0227190 [Cryptomeria japonica]